MGDGARLFVVHGIPSDSVDGGGHLVCDLTGSQGCIPVQRGGSVLAKSTDTLRMP